MGYALRRLAGLLRPPVDVYEAEPGALSVLRDLPVTVRDGTVLRVNVVLPTGQGPFPVVLSAHPYGKDRLPRRGRAGYRVSVQYRMLRQPGRVRFSSLTGWEAPDPAWWAAQGYAAVNCDLRGAGTSEGTASLLSDQEGEDIYDLIEWAGAQPWSTEITGPMALRLWVAARAADDVNLFAGVEKWRGRSYVPFEGSYGFGRDRVTTGWLKVSLRALDERESRSFEPVPACTRWEPLAPGQVVACDIALGPSATYFRAGETLRLVVAGRWLWPRNPLTGQFPAGYERSPRGTCTVHWGPEQQARLLIPVAGRA